ncbi:MAG: HNH endonuclease [Myxococcaceae bacterium]
MPSLTDLTNAELLAHLAALASSEWTTTADQLLSLNEMEDRRAHAYLGFSSVWAYCESVLRWSNGKTGRNLAAARLLRRFPLGANYLRDGRLNCTTFCALRDVLTPENQVELFDRASNLTEQKVLELVAELAPRPDVPERLRKIPNRSHPSPFDATASTPPSPAVTTTSSSVAMATHEGSPALQVGDPSPLFSPPAERTSSSAPATDISAEPTEPFRPTAKLTPLRKDVFKLEMTVDRGIKEELEELKSLLSHKMPRATLGDILLEAIRRTRTACDRQKYGTLAAGPAPTPNPTRSKRTGSEAPTSISPCAPISGATDDPVRAPISGATDGGDPLRAPSSGPGGTEAEPATATGAPISGVSAGDAVSLTPILGVTPSDASACAPNPGVTTSSISSQPSPGSSPRGVPRPVKRFVAERDGRSCQFVGSNGQRCGSKHQVEYEHTVPHARGGESTGRNLRLLCKSHNLLCAIDVFGEEFMRRFIGPRSPDRARDDTATRQPRAKDPA